MSSIWAPGSLPPEQALQRLIDGNTRYREGKSELMSRAFRAELADKQQRPFAIVLGCSDSRSPVETLFDEGLGNLFVVRIAGHVVAPSVVGSIEFAASEFGTRLVVVLGHTRCGAIAATVRDLQSGDEHLSHNIRAITERIAPHIKHYLRAVGPDVTPEALRESMRINVQASVDHLRHGSRMLEDLVLSGQVAIVGAEYELESGRVHFFDDLTRRS